MSRKKNGLGGYGYCDIWMTSNYFKSNEYYLECKGGLVENVKGAKDILNKAITDTKRLVTEDENAIKLAVGFCNIQFHKNDFKLKRNDKIVGLAEEIILTIPKDFFAYCFPHSVQDYYDGDYYYPGVLILGQIVTDPLPCQ